MSTYRLMSPEGSIPYRKIMHGRRWIGRVVKHATESCWLGIIGQTTIRASSATDAFDEVVAQYLGYRSASALRARNADVRRARKLVNAAADRAADRMLGGDYGVADTPAGALLALRGMTRRLRRGS